LGEIVSSPGQIEGVAMSIDTLFAEVGRLIHAGCENEPVSRLGDQIDELRAQGPSAKAAADALQRAIDAPADETPVPLLDAVEKLSEAHIASAHLPSLEGDLDEIDEEGSWSTPMPAETLYLLVPETRPFAKRVKPPDQVEAVEAAAKRGQIADLRLLPIFLKMLNEKAGAAVPDAVAQMALPAYGPSVLPDLWPGMAPESRQFIAAYKIDVQATLARLLDKPTKRGDKGGSVMKAVEKLMASVSGEGAPVGPESLPMLRLALKHAPDATFRRKIAETIARIGPAAVGALPELIDAFEHGGLTRDYQMVRPLVVLGKDSQEVADALVRALEDRDASVRLLAAFNIGQMGAPALGALPTLEEMIERDPDAKVREQAAKTVNKLRLRLEPAPSAVED
jgi:hypothetical protein